MAVRVADSTALDYDALVRLAAHERKGLVFHIAGITTRITPSAALCFAREAEYALHDVLLCWGRRRRMRRTVFDLAAGAGSVVLSWSGGGVLICQEGESEDWG